MRLSQQKRTPSLGRTLPRLNSSWQSSSPSMTTFSPSVHSLDRLFGLPAELRDCIFTLAVKDSEPIIADVLPHDAALNGKLSETNSNANIEYAICPTLPPPALTCRQAYAEVGAVYYRVNTFRFRLHTNHTNYQTFTAHKTFREWLDRPTRRPEHRKLIVNNIRQVNIVFRLSHMDEKGGVQVYDMFDPTTDASRLSRDKSGLVHLHLHPELAGRCICPLLRNTSFTAPATEMDLAFYPTPAVDHWMVLFEENSLSKLRTSKDASELYQLARFACSLGRSDDTSGFFIWDTPFFFPDSLTTILGRPCVQSPRTTARTAHQQSLQITGFRAIKTIDGSSPANDEAPVLDTPASIERMAQTMDTSIETARAEESQQNDVTMANTTTDLTAPSAPSVPPVASTAWVHDNLARGVVHSCNKVTRVEGFAAIPTGDRSIDEAWSEAETDDGRLYYLNKITGATSWGTPATFKPNRIFKLAPELRERIFQFTVHEPKGDPLDAERVEVVSFRDDYSLSCAILPSLPPLALTCKQAYTEIAATFYRENIFRFRFKVDGGRSDSSKFYVWLMKRSIDFQDPSLDDRELPTIDAELQKDRTVAVKYNRKLLSRCTCRLNQILNSCNDAVEKIAESGEDRESNGLIQYCEQVEELVFNYIWAPSAEHYHDDNGRLETRHSYERFFKDVRDCEKCVETSEWAPFKWG
ncbi:WW domain binding protein 4 [Saxophila tyrrhenica]|uniref:WW domain binding protein 4 n=1 Tax=Saxophila tyrrhenica TaxID=1690608 RepID=A0AAV9P6E5_9PEZI|nr:WW domain binding protein 4 [Saxophila tyrrhenica]